MATSTDECIAFTPDAYERVARAVRWVEAQMIVNPTWQPTAVYAQPIGINVVMLDIDTTTKNAPIVMDDGKKAYHAFFCRRDADATDPDQRWLIDPEEGCWVENFDGSDLDPAAELWLAAFCCETLEVEDGDDYDGGIYPLMTVIASFACSCSEKPSGWTDLGTSCMLDLIERTCFTDNTKGKRTTRVCLTGSGFKASRSPWTSDTDPAPSPP